MPFGLLNVLIVDLTVDFLMRSLSYLLSPGVWTLPDPTEPRILERLGRRPLHSLGGDPGALQRGPRVTERGQHQ